MKVLDYDMWVINNAESEQVSEVMGCQEQVWVSRWAAGRWRQYGWRGGWEKIPRLWVWRWRSNRYGMWSQRVRFVTVQLEIVCLQPWFKTGGHVEGWPGQRGGGDRPLTPGGHLVIVGQWGRYRDYQNNQDLVQHLHSQFMESVSSVESMTAVSGNSIIGSHCLQYRATSEGSVQIRLILF